MNSSSSILPGSASRGFFTASRDVLRRDLHLGFRGKCSNVAPGVHIFGAPQCGDALRGNVGCGGAWLDFSLQH